MKKFILAMSMPAMFLLVSCDKETVIQDDDLPGKATSFINTHYSTHAILQVVKDRDDLKVEYHVFLDNNTKIDFNREGDVKQIVGTERIPDAVLPSLIITYVNTNYPTAFIRSWDPGKSDQEVGISTGIELLFDSNGNFLRVDN
ncbi:MAG: PepSY-like domain-containing protein [Chitinophagaceae bacterium]